MKLEVGANEIDIPQGDYKVHSVCLMGLRRPTWLVEVNEEDFKARPQEMRAVPVMYWVDGKKIRLWPAAAHEWNVHVDLEERTHEPRPVSDSEDAKRSSGKGR